MRNEKSMDEIKHPCQNSNHCPKQLFTNLKERFLNYIFQIAINKKLFISIVNELSEEMIDFGLLSCLIVYDNKELIYISSK